MPPLRSIACYFKLWSEAILYVHQLFGSGAARRSSEIWGGCIDLCTRQEQLGKKKSSLPAGENPNFFFSIEQLISIRAPCRSCSVSTPINQCDAIEAARALCDLCPMCHLSGSHPSTIISGQCWTLLRSRSSSCRGSIEGSDYSYHVQTCSLHWFLNLISGWLMHSSQ
jgi:hypothetical protein